MEPARRAGYTFDLAQGNDSPSQDLPGGWGGRVIDQRYRIVRPLGEGAMGSVFVADHLTLHKQVALKVVRAEFAGNRELLARFAREALAGAKIEHPSVVPALDYGPLDEGGAYLVMPLVPGASLTDVLLARGRLPWQHVAHWGAQIADALAAAWAHGFIHRDLKPDNILLESRPGDPAVLPALARFGADIAVDRGQVREETPRPDDRVAALAVHRGERGLLALRVAHLRELAQRDRRGAGAAAGGGPPHRGHGG